MVFITAGLEDRGRVSSHPKREAGPSKKKTRTDDEDEERLELVPANPLAAAWDESLSLSNHGVPHVVHVAALHTSLQKVIRGAEEDSGVRFNLSFSHMLPPETHRPNVDDEFKVNTQCIIHLSPDQKEDDDLINSYCVFLYEASVTSFS
jgi:hypothetical protein